jgi:PAS domain S-box-containing protein
MGNNGKMGALGRRSREIVTGSPLAWLAMLLSLIATAGGWYITSTHVQADAEHQFTREVERIRSAIVERMLIYEDMLHGAVGLYAASYSVERHEWKAYLDSVSIEKRFPGVDAVGFVARVPRERLEEFLRITREDNSPWFEVRTEGDRDEMMIVKYIEPEPRHRRQLGRDLGTEPELRRVAEQARDTGRATLSRRLLLRAEDGKRPGFLMVLPVYLRGQPVTTREERRAHIEGWVYARFIAEDFMNGMLQTLPAKVRCRMYDGARPDAESLLYDTDPAIEADAPRFAATGSVSVAGQPWTLEFFSRPDFEAGISRAGPRVALAGGATISMLLFAIVWSLSTMRTRAERLAAEMTAALRATEARLQAILDNSPTVVYLKDLEGRYLLVNQRFEKLFRVQRERAAGRTDHELFSREEADAFRANDRQVIASRAPMQFEEVATHDGAPHTYISIKFPLLDDRGTPVAVCGISTDITARKRAEETLARERNILRSLIDNLPDHIYVKDQHCRYVVDNAAHLKFLGADSPEQVIGRSVFDFFPRELAERYFRDDQRVLESGEALIAREEPITDPAGRQLWVATTKVPLRDASGQIIGLVGISRDITERKRAQEQLQRTAEELARSNADLEQFAWVASHDLQEPLRMVAGYVQLLERRYKGRLDADAEEFIGFAVDGAKRMQTLINDLLAYSRIATRGKPPAPTDAGQALEGALANLKLAIQDCGAAVTRGKLPTVMADPTQLSQLFQNLIGNALKFKGAAPPAIHVDATERNGEWVFAVKDNGIGIEPKDRERIFQLFQRLHGHADYPGTGIGLAVCKKIVERHGGRIWVESEPGRGSTFYFTIPNQGTHPS